MLLLLPFLLITTAPYKLTALSVLLQEQGTTAPGSVVERVEVEVKPGLLMVRARVRRTDVTAREGDVEEREWRHPSEASGLAYAGLQSTLRTLRDLDRGQNKVVVIVDDNMPTSSLIAVMDVVRDGAGFQDVVLGGFE